MSTETKSFHITFILPKVWGQIVWPQGMGEVIYNVNQASFKEINWQHFTKAYRGRKNLCSWRFKIKNRWWWSKISGEIYIDLPSSCNNFTAAKSQNMDKRQTSVVLSVTRICHYKCFNDNQKYQAFTGIHS